MNNGIINKLKDLVLTIDEHFNQGSIISLDSYVEYVFKFIWEELNEEENKKLFQIIKSLLHEYLYKYCLNNNIDLLTIEQQNIANLSNLVHSYLMANHLYYWDDDDKEQFTRIRIENDKDYKRLRNFYDECSYYLDEFNPNQLDILLNEYQQNKFKKELKFKRGSIVYYLSDITPYKMILVGFDYTNNKYILIDYDEKYLNINDLNIDMIDKKTNIYYSHGDNIFDNKEIMKQTILSKIDFNKQFIDNVNNL